MKPVIDMYSIEHKASLGLGDKGMCMNCRNGACTPKEVKYNGAALQLSGCVSAILYYHLPHIFTTPENNCSCFHDYGEKRHPREEFLGVKMTQGVLPTESEIGTASTGLAMVDKAVVNDPSQ